MKKEKNTHIKILTAIHIYNIDARSETIATYFVSSAPLKYKRLLLPRYGHCLLIGYLACTRPSLLWDRRTFLRLQSS